MPNLVRYFEGSTGPLLDLYVSVNSTEARAMIEQGASPPDPVRVFKALVDTGAGQTQIALGFLERLGLSPVSDEEAKVRSATTGDDCELMEVYSVNLLVDHTPMKGEYPPHSLDLLAEELHVVGSPKLGGLNVEMLLGRDVLSRCLLVYDGWTGYYTLAYEALSQAASESDQGGEDES